MRAATAGALLAALLAVGSACAQDGLPALGPVEEGLAVATFAGGCFWCMEPPYDMLPGVKRTISGFTGGRVERPTYEQVTYGDTGHLEAVRVVYDPRVVGYGTLLDVFWRNVDPLDDGGQFCDRGASYRTAIFVHTQEQRRLAQASLDALAASARFDDPIVTPIEVAGPFYPADDGHQDFYLENPVRYHYYRFSCGRGARLEELWGTHAGG